MKKYRIGTIKDILDLFPTEIIYEEKVYNTSFEIYNGNFQICFRNKDYNEMKIIRNESLSDLRNEVLEFIKKWKIIAIWKK